MPLLSKQKRKSKEQPRTVGGKYNTKKTCKNGQDSLILEVSYNDNDFFDDGSCYFNDDTDSFDDNGGDSSSFIDDIPADDINFEFFDDEVWSDDDDSGWDEPEEMEAEIKLHQRLKNFDLQGPYKTSKTPKSTYYDKYGPNGTLTKAAAGTEKITNFFKISSTQVTNPQLSRADTLEVFSSDSESEVVNPYIYKITEKIKNLKKQLEKQHNQLTVDEYNYKRAIFEYLTLLNNNNGHRKIDISLEVAQKIFIDGGVWKAKKIRYLTKYWLLNNKLPESRCGKHQKTIRIIDDEDVAERCHIWIRKQDFKATPALFKKFIETELFPSIGITREKSIALMTAARWLNVLDYSFQQYRRGIYYDRHERDDVVQYRKEFLEKMFEHEKYMSKYEGESIDQIHPNLPEGEKERILGYWTAEHLLEQIEYKAIPIFEALYSDCVAVFAFDNSSNHAAFSKDALVASRMNLNPGGKQPVMRNTYFGPNNQLQSMVFPTTHYDKKLRGKPKGIKQVLMERGKWPSGGLVLECSKCKEKCQDSSRTSCYARRVISLEPNFLAQKGAIEELIENAGHKCIFFPKFHCELNFIERY
ncbi:hypothetical protein GLOIN_2v1785920 [Rhizophagus irregularis DAOM 181602=DAOM 197198]|uniref:Uncharacterized protein n=1 Tax=Rhizophagus irregularis (strain DAOM 181602 / DAOM 197198 / MUCL 43194) TaxID=747089 RepID=A0A2P4P9E5_RHIID|nr:hypothetical protein GLOIN_2v1785920 [Rhizophagus irregularis DAOM 181602=DAOM 197198]POG61994.1 hypothetical protein GLOIN_2v1785920 [Rhizophagus irregularis DAOM 181602=DAOM 197198]|eukprot:XP_025168860.1 hypothetical protein GLOIN_2v1785920 [Rhizophagus irregularis DAOM 181602=DAOM 197198]